MLKPVNNVSNNLLKFPFHTQQATSESLFIHCILCYRTRITSGVDVRSNYSPIDPFTQGKGKNRLKRPPESDVCSIYVTFMSGKGCHQL